MIKETALEQIELNLNYSLIIYWGGAIVVEGDNCLKSSNIGLSQVKVLEIPVEFCCQFLTMRRE